MQSPVSRDEGTFRSGTLLCSLKPEQLTPDNILVPIDLVGGRERHDSQRTGSDQVSVLSLLQALQGGRDASGASTTEFIAQFLTIWHMISTVHLQPSVQDQLLWRWTANGHYSSALAYRAFFIGRMPLCGAKDVWAASTPPKAKFFFWLALHGRLWTA